VLLAAFVNFSAVCEQLRRERRPLHIVCAGDAGQVALEDALLAGALVESLCDVPGARLNDGARLAWDCFEHHGQCLEGALAVGAPSAMMTTSGRRRAWTSSPSCRSCAATRCGSRSGRSGS